MPLDSGGHVTVTPLPPSVAVEDAISFLHDHPRMIELNPLVIDHEPTGPGLNVPQEQVDQYCWYLITDAVSYLPGQNGVKTDVSYKACFQNRPDGLRIYTYAPGGVDISSTWTVEEENTSFGRRLCLKESVETDCDVPIANFITRNSDRTHAALVDAILAKMEEDSHRKAVIQEILMTERWSRRAPQNATSRPHVATRPSKASRGPRLSIVMPPPRLSSEALCARGRHGPDCPHNFVATHGAIDAYSPGPMPSPAHNIPTFKTPIFNAVPPPFHRINSSEKTPTARSPLSARRSALPPFGRSNSRDKTPILKSAPSTGLPALLNRLSSSERVTTLQNRPSPVARMSSGDRIPILASTFAKHRLTEAPAVTIEPPSATDIPVDDTRQMTVHLVPSSPVLPKATIASDCPKVVRPALDRTAACDKIPILVELPASDLLTMKPLPPIRPEDTVAEIVPMKRHPPLLRADSAEYTPRIRPSSRNVSRNNSSEQTPTLYTKSPHLNPDDVAKVFELYSPIAEHPCFCEHDASHDEGCPFYDSDASSSSNDEASSPVTPPQRHAELATVSTDEGLIFETMDLKPLPLNIKCSLRRQKKQPTKRLTIVIPPLPAYLQE